MYREAIKKLEEWKNSKYRKPLILEGARQVGKTWLVKEFAALHYKNFIYVNFEEQVELRGLFKNNLNVERIVLELEAISQIKIEPENTLIFFDEIQEAENGITSLKYFCEEAPNLNLIAAGSLLGILLHQRISFPVGKVSFLTLYPMNLIEFLIAMKEEKLADLIKEERWDSIQLLRNRYETLLRQYMYIGGMPEAVKSFVETKDWRLVRRIQEDIISAYNNDFSKHAPKEIVPRIQQVWNSLPSQLSKENKKFIYGVIRVGARAKEYELAIQWLEDSGLIHKVNNVSAPRFPLSAYKDLSIFKIYCNDIGLLGAMSGLNSKTIVVGNEIFTEFKGAMTEQFVFQQLIQGNKLYYWSKPNAQQEIDFIIQKESEIFPIEVKSGENLQSKSLKQFIKEHPGTHAFRLSLSDFRKEQWITNLPLYCASYLNRDDPEA
ncbi:MAG: ATP-binding protein [Muribaculaceae bacterium]|nr:ATP-binding protein [Muribaculaceae bacterium]